VTWTTHITRRVTPLLALLPAIAVATGCDLLEQYEDSGGTVNVFSTHHATPRDGDVPERNGNAIRTTTDTGWDLIVSEAHLTTVGVTLNHCDGERAHAVDMYFGAYAENLRAPDLELEGVGAVTVPEGKYCSVTVEYGPYFSGGEASGTSAAELEENTVFFAGLATRDGIEVPFELTAAFAVEVTTQLDKPLSLDHFESFAKDVSLSKTIDRFFDGIEDFDQMDQVGLEEHFAATLERETRAVLGTSVTPGPAY